ncbi:MAG: NAD-dependent dehydratase [Thermoleophilia bacterium]|nr:NAD-dependent dehydratase [Thermoleophilia bacterium]
MLDARDNESFLGRQCLITGGLGFVGSSLANRLVELGANVTLVDSMVPDFGGNLANVATVGHRVSINYSDVRDRLSMNWIVRDQDYVFHCAGQVSHVMSLTDPFPDIDYNITGLTVLLEALRHHNPTAKVVFASTRGAYGEVAQLPVNEEQPSNPKALHEISKLAGELILKAYAQQHGIESVALRLSNTYGPRSQMLHGKFGVVNYFLRLAMDGEVLKVFGDGSTQRDYLYIDDAVDAFLLAALESTPGESPIYNVGRSEPTTILELVQAVIVAAGNGGWDLAPYSDERKAQEPGHYYSDITKIRTRLGWEPRVELADGLARTVSYYQSRRDSYWPRLPVA